MNFIKFERHVLHTQLRTISPLTRYNSNKFNKGSKRL